MFFQLLGESLTPETMGDGGGSWEHIWLDVVWALSVLDKQTDTQLASVLSSDFYNKLLCKFSSSL